jgi:hypothetical protein
LIRLFVLRSPRNRDWERRSGASSQLNPGILWCSVPLFSNKFIKSSWRPKSRLSGQNLPAQVTETSPGTRVRVGGLRWCRRGFTAGHFSTILPESSETILNAGGVAGDPDGAK